MADLIIYGGTIIPMDDTYIYTHSNIESIAIKQGKIIHIGSYNEVLKQANSNTKYIELQGNQALLPGFIEPHQHALQQALTKCLYTLCTGYDNKSYSEIKSLFEKTIAAIDPESREWCIFFGWDPEIIYDLPELSSDFLDSFSTDIPILVLGQSGHTSWANHKAFKLAGIGDDVEDPPGGHFVRDFSGKLTGQMLEIPATLMVFPMNPPGLNKENLQQAFDDQWREYANSGFTTVTDLMYLPDNTLLNSVMLNKAESEDCSIRLALYQKDAPGLMSPKVLPKSDKVWISGIKLFADGSPHCGTAALHEEYLHNKLTQTLGFPEPPNSGTTNFTKEDLQTRIRFWHDKGQQIAVHAHGERAIEQTLDIMEEVLRDSPKHDHRHRIEHVGLCEEQHIKRATEIGVSFSFFVQHLYYYATTYKEKILGPERTQRWAPLRLAVKHKNLWTIHQDHPTFPGPPEPFTNLMTAVTRTERGKPDTVYGPEYRIPIEEALKGYTINAAKQIHKDTELGSVTVGKRADLVILNENPLKVDSFKLVDIKVLDTFLDGRSNGITERNEKWVEGKLIYSYQ